MRSYKKIVRTPSARSSINSVSQPHSQVLASLSVHTAYEAEPPAPPVPPLPPP
jgi:hypothetical protein